MLNSVFVKKYQASELPPVNREEALRYAGNKGQEESVADLMDRCVLECESDLEYKVCYLRTDLEVDGDRIRFPFGEIVSKHLSKNLRDCREAVLFGATIGIEIDRLIAKNTMLSPAKSVCLQGIGAERIETLCDGFNDWIREEEKKKGYTTRPRFSPGYGDFSLEDQKLFFHVLDCNRKIGLTLNESMLMSPSKSVTAIIGIKGKAPVEEAGCYEETGDKEKKNEKCSNCEKKECVFRK